MADKETSDLLFTAYIVAMVGKTTTAFKGCIALGNLSWHIVVSKRTTTTATILVHCQ